MNSVVPALLLAFSPSPSDRAALVEGVDSLVAPGALPGAVVAAKSAFVVMRTGDVPTVAAGPVAAGRAMLAGHGGFFSRDALKNPSNARLFANSLAWLGRRGGTKGLRIGLFQTDDVAAAAQALGAETINIRRADLKAGLAKVDVLMMGQNALDGDAAAQAEVVAWTKAGHGLYSAGPAWGWQQLNPNKNLRTDLSVNRMLLPFGLGLSGDFADGKPIAAGSDDPLLQTDHALAALRKGGLADAATVRAGGAVSRALALSPLDDPTLVAEIRRLAAKEGEKWPVTGTMPFTRLRAILDHRAWLEQGPETVRANPSAALFPGPVPKEAKRGSRTVEIDTKVPDWHGVGLYAAPGEVISVSLPAEAAGKGIGVRIGAHTDGLWDTKDWNRFPEISRRWALDATKTKIASPFGGTIFLDVPQGATLGKVSVTIEGAVPAVRYVRGKTTKAEWDRMRREPGGPWVEMEAKEIILSLPRSAIQNLEDPETAMAYWDEVAELCYELYAAPRRPRAERFCVDRQISVGYMHAGYPIMTHEDVSDTFVDVPKMRSKDFPWGFYHELGHNFQEPTWTFEGTGEVTNNLFSLYACQKINGIAHPGAMSLEEKKPRMEKYFAKGAKYEDWQSDPFLALTMYDQIREAFGWEPFKKAFANYHRLRLNPKDEGERRDTWMIQISEATGRNLGPFFTMWGVPTSEAARASVAKLPKWMPAETPKL
jgi:hypothetical protein